jgi:rubredoxin
MGGFFITNDKINIKEFFMAKHECKVCGYVYDVEEGDRENGVAPGTAFEDIPENWACPICGATKSYFEQKED